MSKKSFRVGDTVKVIATKKRLTLMGIGNLKPNSIGKVIDIDTLSLPNIKVQCSHQNYYLAKEDLELVQLPVLKKKTNIKATKKIRIPKLTPRELEVNAAISRQAHEIYDLELRQDKILDHQKQIIDQMHRLVDILENHRDRIDKLESIAHQLDLHGHKISLRVDNNLNKLQKVCKHDMKFVTLPYKSFSHEIPGLFKCSKCGKTEERVLTWFEKLRLKRYIKIK